MKFSFFDEKLSELLKIQISCVSFIDFEYVEYLL